MKKTMLTAVFAILSGGAAYAGGLEGERAAGGLKFGETAITGEAPAVRMNVDFEAAPKAAFTADIKKEAFRVPAIGKAGNKDTEDKGAGTGAAIGTVSGAFAGGAIGRVVGIVGGIALTIAIGAAIGGPLGIIAGIGIVLLGGIRLAGSLGALAGVGIGAAIGAGIGAIVGAFNK